MSAQSVLLKEAEASVVAGRWDQAIEQLEALRSQEVRSRFVYSHLTQAMAVRGKYLTVLSLYLEWAGSAIATENWDQAEEALGYAVSLRPDSIEVQEMGVRIAGTRGDRDSLMPRLLSLSSLCLERGDTERAVSAIKEAIDLDPQSPNLKLKLAEVLVSVGQIQAAVAQYDACIIELEMVDNKEAVYQALRRLKIIQPSDISHLIQYGRVCGSLNRWDEAEEQFRAVLKLDLENREALLELAKACRKNGRFRNALLAINRAIQLDQTSGAMRAMAGRIHANMGDLDGALAEFRKAADLHTCAQDKEELETVLQEIKRLETGQNINDDIIIEELKVDPHIVEPREAPVSPPSHRKPMVKKAEFRNKVAKHKPLYRGKRAKGVEELSLREGLRPKGDSWDKPLFKDSRSTTFEEPAVEESPVFEEVEIEFEEVVIERDLVPLVKDQELENIPPFEDVFTEISELFPENEISEVELESETEEVVVPEVATAAPEIVIEDPEPVSLVPETQTELDLDVLFPIEETILEPQEPTLSIFEGFVDDEDWSPLFPEEPEELEQPEEQSEESFEEEMLLETWLDEEPYDVLEEEPVEVLPELEFEPEPELEPLPIFLELPPIPEPQTPPDLGSLLDDTLPQDPDALEWDPQRSQTAQEPLDVGEVLSHYRDSLITNPTDEQTAWELAELCLRHGLLEEAYSRFRSLAQVSPGSVPTLTKIVKTALWMENYPAAKAALWDLSHLHFARGELSCCQEKLGDLLSLEPEHKDARQLMVQVFLAGDQPKLAAWHLGQMVERWVADNELLAAAEALQKLQEIAPSESAMERLAELYQKLNKGEEALSILRLLRNNYREKDDLIKASLVAQKITEMADFDPSDRETLIDLLQEQGREHEVFEHSLKLADSHSKRGDLGAASTLLHKVLKMRPHNLETEQALVEVYLQCGNNALATQYSENVADTLLDRKDYNLGCSIFKKWTRSAPTSTQMRERLAQFFQLNGDIENAKLEWMLATECYLSDNDYTRAARSLEMALELEPSQIEWRQSLAELKLQKLEDPEAALVDFRKIFELRPEPGTATEFYLEILIAKGEFSEVGAILASVTEHSEGTTLKTQTMTKVRERMQAVSGNDASGLEWGKLCLAIGDLDSAIEQFQKLRRNPDFEFHSHHLLGVCFSRKKGFNMLDLALSQFVKALETKSPSTQALLQLRYDLGSVLKLKGENQKALEQFLLAFEMQADYRDLSEQISELQGR